MAEERVGGAEQLAAMPDVVANAPISRNIGTTAKLKSVTVRIVV